MWSHFCLLNSIRVTRLYGVMSPVFVCIRIVCVSRLSSGIMRKMCTPHRLYHVRSTCRTGSLRSASGANNGESTLGWRETRLGTRKTLSLNGSPHDRSTIVQKFRRLSPRFSETQSPKSFSHKKKTLF